MENLKKKLAETYEEYELDPIQYSTIKGVPQPLAVRLDTFTKSGVLGESLVEAIRKAGPEVGPATKGWVEVMMEYGEKAYGDACDMLEESWKRAAKQEFLMASFWFFLARFPYISSNSAAKAYQRHIESYKKAMLYSEHKMEEVFIPFKRKKIPAYLRIPEVSNVESLVILCGGTDVWKSDIEIHIQSEALLSQGIATLSIDHPGTGQCPPLSPEEEEKYFLAVLDYIKHELKIYGSRVAFYGLSFGGIWAVKLSILAPELLAAVNIGGPAHLSFKHDWALKFPIPLQKALGVIVGADPLAEKESFLGGLAARSVESLKDKMPANGQKVPLLCINGDKDEVVPIEEYDYLKNLGFKLDTLIFAGDRHVASKNVDLRDAFATMWVARKLGV
jgi:esterase FrsA